MGMCDLDPESLFEEVLYEVKDKIENLLNRDGNWKKVALTIMKDNIMRIEKISDLERLPSPAGSLLQQFVVENITVFIVQLLLYKSGLYEILDILITNEKGRFITPVQDSSKGVQPGQPCELKVDVFGSPYPKFKWFHNGNALLGHTCDKLLIPEFCEADVGEYVCQILQTIKGEKEECWSPKFTLSIEKSCPSIIPGKDLQNMKLNTGEELVLNVGVVAEPQPLYIWYKNGVEVTRGLHNTYKITNVGMSNSGKYSCEIVNDVGSCCSKEVTVEVSAPCFAPDKPVITTRPQVLLSSYALGDHVNLSFKVHCRHNVEFSCTINDECLSDLDKHQHTYTSKSLENDFHIFNLHYEVNKNDWIRGNRGPIIILFEAYSNGYCVSSVVKIKVEENFTEKQFSARNKFALLIANMDYSKDGLLSPVKDMEALANELTNLQFRCMTCRNVTKAELLDILDLFSSYLQAGDYVVFYYAGHGYHDKGVDFMIPLHAKYKHTWKAEDVLQEDACVTTTEVINRFQESEPALIFSVHDTCRTQPSFSDSSLKLKVPPKIAKGNAYTIYATSESYGSFEVEYASSLLMEELIRLVRKPISVQELGRQVLSAFNHKGLEDNDHGLQVPKVDSDLGDSRSLTDPWTPCEDDNVTVLSNWERMSNVGGTKFQKVQIEDTMLEVSVSCEQEGYPMIISNCIDVVISIALDGQHDVKPLLEKELKVCLILNTTVEEVTKEVTGDAIRCPVLDLQALNEDLMLTLHFLSKEEYIGSCKFNLEKPSLCNIRNSQSNDLST